jgi:hypothetical protein
VEKGAAYYIGGFEEARTIRRVQADRTDDFAYLVPRCESGLLRIVANPVDSARVDIPADRKFLTSNLRSLHANGSSVCPSALVTTLLAEHLLKKSARNVHAVFRRAT